MAIVTAPGRFCYLECDEPACGRKIYQYHEEVVQELARLSGWKNSGDFWTCPACSAKNGRPRLRVPEEPAKGQGGAHYRLRGERPLRAGTPRGRRTRLARWP